MKSYNVIYPFREHSSRLENSYLCTRRFTETLIALLSEEDCIVQSMPDAIGNQYSRPKQGLLSRLTYRIFFSPASRWQFTGIRLAKGNKP